MASFFTFPSQREAGEIEFSKTISIKIKFIEFIYDRILEYKFQLQIIQIQITTKNL